MRNFRILARLDIKGNNLIKGIHLEGLRVIGSPDEYAAQYYREGIDELILMDSVASLYGRNHLTELVESITKNVFVPLTVGGGIRTIDDVKKILRSGADKVAINSAAIKNPKIISSVASNFGSQCMVLSVEAKQTAPNKWEAYIDNGRERTGIDVIDWINEAITLGAGEILLTSIDKDGTRKGFDIPLIREVCNIANIPVIASGGMGKLEDLLNVAIEGGADAAAIGSILHYKILDIFTLRAFAIEKGINVREYQIE